MDVGETEDQVEKQSKRGKYTKQSMGSVNADTK
jgi:hypothetical protein